MSQEKIDAYKKEKAGRKERIEKQKKRKKIAKIVSSLVIIAIVAAIVGSVIYNKFGKSDETAAAADASATEISVELADDTAAEASTAE
ncbi:hypothetical protein [Butyrivibrio sp. MC2021]|uniref:hypothetical protein n=1 Tax=Butyrivibrio sp. MC2021 TaxID=1408306 RepID=UPI00056716F5|nr:hypothetical protein [Butyrivibrio sp. MC2021]